MTDDEKTEIADENTEIDQALDGLHDGDEPQTEPAEAGDLPNALDMNFGADEAETPAPNPEASDTPELPEAEAPTEQTTNDNIDTPSLEESSSLETAPVANDEASAQEVVENMQTYLSVELGKVSLSLLSLADIKRGYVLELAQKPGDPVDLVVGGKAIGRGELVNVEGELGVRVISLVK